MKRGEIEYMKKIESMVIPMIVLSLFFIINIFNNTAHATQSTSIEVSSKTAESSEYLEESESQKSDVITITTDDNQQGSSMKNENISSGETEIEKEKIEQIKKEEIKKEEISTNVLTGEFDSRLSSVGQRALPNSLSGDDVGQGYPNLYSDGDWWEHINNVLMRRYIENWLNDLSATQHLGYRKGDQMTIDLHNLFKIGGQHYINNTMKTEAPTMASAITTAPGGGEEWFVIDAADTILNGEQSNWLNKGWRSANNTSDSKNGFINVSMTNTPKTGQASNGSYSWEINKATRKMIVTRERTNLSAQPSQNVIRFGRVDYNNSVNTKDWNGSGWEARAGEAREGYFFPKMAIHLESAKPLKLSQQATPSVRIGEEISKVIGSDFKWREYIKVAGIRPDSNLEMTVIDDHQYFSKDKKTVKVKVTESLDGEERSEIFDLGFDVIDYELDIDPITNLNRKLSEGESISGNPVVSKLDSPITDTLKFDLLLKEKGIKKVGDYAIDVKVSGEGIVDSKTKKPTTITSSLGSQAKDAYSSASYLKDLDIEFVAGKSVNFTLYYVEEGKLREIGDLKRIITLDATPPTGKLKKEIATLVNVIPNPNETLDSVEDETTEKVGVSFIGDVKETVAEPSIIKDGIVDLKELKVQLIDDAGNSRVIHGNILAVLEKKIWIEGPNELELSSKELLIDAEEQPTIISKRVRIADTDLGNLLISKGIRGYYYDEGKLKELSEDEFSFFGLPDISYSPTFANPVSIKVTGHHDKIVSESFNIDVTVVDGELVMKVPSDLNFESKLSLNPSSQTNLTNEAHLLVNDNRFAEDGWQISANATTFNVNDKANSKVATSDMDLMMRLPNQSDQSLITNGGVSFENNTQKNKDYHLSESKGEASLYLATRKSGSWAKVDQTYQTTINWEVTSTIKLPEATFLAPRLKEGSSQIEN